MTIKEKLEDRVLTVEVAGRLDTSTSTQLSDALQDLENIQELILDFKELEYVSSAGLRVILATQKKMSQHGSMKIKNVCPSIMEVFEITGFTDIFTIEK